MARPISAGLHLVATPIGNLGDITPRALVTIAGADRAFCEDTRVSGPMLARFSVTRRLSVYHEHNADSARKEIMALLAGGASVALISDAGMPAISDPGFKLVREAIGAGHDVYTVPGPTALAAAVSVSGLPTDSFFFAGFLPPKSIARRQRIDTLAGIPATLIFYESPHRAVAALEDLAAVLGPRAAAVARELTKKFEEVRRGTLVELASLAAAEPPRGEIAIVVGPPGGADPAEVDDATILDAARTALATMRPAAAAKTISQELGVPRARVYDLILTLKQNGP
ncbi:MAG: 16S rRNA (cytidine(1402)-2'-O)-methyltransferase [Alphaproteobacteria bacterium]|nr:16S rRNA (cytidine(1402)-2'-O)-methyltransferase [Alphaproteobacteria bacterium]